MLLYSATGGLEVNVMIDALRLSWKWLALYTTHVHKEKKRPNIIPRWKLFLGTATSFRTRYLISRLSSGPAKRANLPDRFLFSFYESLSSSSATIFSPSKRKKENVLERERHFCNLHDANKAREFPRGHLVADMLLIDFVLFIATRPCGSTNFLLAR